MKKLFISLEPITQQYRGHRALLNSICLDIALYNGGNYGNPEEKDADKFIAQLFRGNGLNLVKVKDWEYRFGHQKSKEYVQYGVITKTAVF